MPKSLDQVTPLILTYNEEANIRRTLAGLRWARRIVVVDSFSSDSTLELLAQHQQVEVVQRVFDTHATQWNHGLDQIRTEWALCLDADYQVSDAFCKELHDRFRFGLEGIDALIAPFRYLVYGHALRQCVYPAKVVMFRVARGRYCDDGHTQLANIQGRTLRLRSPILHDDRKSLSRWFWAQERYARLEVEKLLNTPRYKLRTVDKLRRLHVVAPFAVLGACLISRQGLLDGWRGWFYAFQRMVAELILSLMLWEARHGK